MQLVEGCFRRPKARKQVAEYQKNTGFNQTAYDALLASELVEVRIIAATQPQLVSGTSGKTAEIMELNLVADLLREIRMGPRRLGSR